MGFLQTGMQQESLEEKSNASIKHGHPGIPAPLSAEVMMMQEARKGIAKAINLSTGAPIRTISA